MAFKLMPNIIQGNLIFIYLFIFDEKDLKHVYPFMLIQISIH